MTVTFLHVNLVIETPTIIVKESIKNWYTVYTDYIPARTFYGAIITYLAKKGIDPLKIKYAMNVSDLYPATYGYSLPAIPFVLTCKDKDHIKRDLLRELIDKLHYEEVKPNTSDLEKLYRYLIEKIKTCKINGYSISSDYLIRSIAGKPIYCTCGEQDTCRIHKSIRTIVLESVGVSPVTRGSYAGLVYTYEALSPGSNVHGLIACSEEVAEILKNELNNALIYMGRGISRGYGRVRITSISNRFAGKYDIRNLIEESFRKIFSEYSRDNQVLVSLSPLVIKGYEDLFPAKSLEDFIKTISLTTELYIGWSKLYGILKPIYNMLGHGSIIYMALKKDYRETINRYEEILLSNPGINLLMPLDVYGKLLLGG